MLRPAESPEPRSAREPLLSPDEEAIIRAACDVIAGHESDLIAFRRLLHASPEISFAEVAATDAVMERLSLEGLQPRRLGSGTGLICDIGDDEADAVALRAELDALAMEDGKDVPYRSRTPGAAHACGHDVHTSAVLGAGLALKSLADKGLLPGRVRLIFEPGEESVPGGAIEIVQHGWLTGVSRIFAVHCDPKLDVGTIGCRIGAITSASDLVEVTLRGPGGHTARPQLTVNLVEEAARVVERLPVAVSERMGGRDGVRLVFGSIHSGSAANVIPTKAVIRGSLRTRDPLVWPKAEQALRESMEEVLGSSGANWELRYVRGVPTVVNDAEATRTLARVGRSLLGRGSVVKTGHSWGGDSFGWMTESVPGAFARLGTHRPGSPDYLDLHNSMFDVDERCVAIGARLLAAAAVDYLLREVSQSAPKSEL
ncbi:MAG: amidohydrolase [Candidatus Nanopelagicales bacterium]|nr:amidohydrolase [Candidatus Nanopelagicales bacterium]MDZ4250714.1 amidohydrolase [Candidatus Nanopelagicales bacterium]